MSFDSLTNRVSYVGASNASVFPYTFLIQDQGDLRVLVTDGVTLTLLTITTDYTVSGVAEDAGGSVILVNASQAWLSAGNLKTGYTLVLRRAPPLTQETDIRNQGAFFPEEHEEEFDKGRMIDQAQEEELGRSLKLPENFTPSTFSPLLPVALPAGSVIRVNSLGTGFTAEAVSNTSLALGDYLGGGYIPQTDGIIGSGQSGTSLAALLFNQTLYRAVHISAYIHRQDSSQEAAAWYDLYLRWNVGAAQWRLVQVYQGDDVGVDFAVSAGGQVSYSSSTFPGTGHAGTIKFKAETFNAV